MSLYIARSSAVAARSLDNEMIVMSARDSTLFTLNEVAREIWQAADGRTPLADIVRDLVCSKFEAEPGAAYADAEAFCRGLAEHGVLLISDQPIPAGS
ncbi:MAG: PqqD family protein [Bryobacteraceae bacterium]|jgi:hypothetical protein